MVWFQFLQRWAVLTNEMGWVGGAVLALPDGSPAGPSASQPLLILVPPAGAHVSACTHDLRR